MMRPVTVACPLTLNASRGKYNAPFRVAAVFDSILCSQPPNVAHAVRLPISKTPARAPVVGALKFTIDCPDIKIGV